MLIHVDWTSKQSMGLREGTVGTDLRGGDRTASLLTQASQGLASLTPLAISALVSHFQADKRPLHPQSLVLTVPCDLVPSWWKTVLVSYA